MKAAAKPPVTKIKENKAEIVALMRSKQFLAAVQTIWPEARTLTEAERSEDAQFREQIILVREDNAASY